MSEDSSSESEQDQDKSDSDQNEVAPLAKSRYQLNKEANVVLVEEGSDKRICFVCGVRYDKYLTKQGKEPTKCPEHMAKQRKVDKERPERDRDIKAEMEKNPERKAKRKKWEREH